MVDPVQVGAFEISQPLGRGATGIVWRAVHRRQQVDVAIKVLAPAPGALAPEIASAFRNEVRAVAGMQHPNVVLLLDHGEVPPEVARQSGGTLPERAPWLAMELVQGGTLAAARGTLRWPAVKSLLLGLLDGLAHAHAHGVVHRDLKPANVLLEAPPDAPGFGPRSVKLTDFGLAHLAEGGPDGVVLVRSGTPTYMAPEQFEGRWRDFGPWTDLYAVGVLGWRLVTSALPFPQKSWDEAAVAHRKQPLPRFAPTMPVPPGTEHWLRRLLHKDAARRFPRAADAAWELLLLDREAPDGDAGAIVAHDAGATTLVFGPLRALTPMPAPDRGARDEAQPLPPIPGTWRPAEAPRPPPRLLGAGLGLYGLRPIPLVDRLGERDRMWTALTSVAATRRPRGIVLEGPWGTGKSRLAAWLGQRAHEVGAAILLRAYHEEVPAPGGGLEPMLARHLRVDGLPREEVIARLRGVLGHHGLDDDVLAVTELVKPATEEERRAGAPVVRLGSLHERHVLLRRVLAAVARERPLVLWLDDVQWGSEALAFAMHVFTARTPLPALVLATWRDDTGRRHPAENALVDALTAREDVERLRVDSLAAEDGDELLQSVGLDRGLARRVGERTAGNPLFSVQLVGSWVQAGLLVPGDRGFRLRAGARTELPDDLHAIWVRRLELLLAGRPERAVAGLELAAVLGQHVDRDEWADACARADLEAAAELVEALLGQRLATRTADGFDFVHGMLRDSLVRRAGDAGRLPALHAAAADALAARSGAAIHERRARHLVGAGRDAEAIGPFKEAAVERTRSGQWDTCLQLLDDRDAALARAGVPPTDQRWGLGDALRATIAFLRGQGREAYASAGVLIERARREEWPQVLAEALFARAASGRQLEHHEGALALLAEAEAAAERAGDPVLAARCVGQRGWQLVSLGRPADAEVAFAECARRYAARGEPFMHSIAEVGLGCALTLLGRYDEADVVFQRALRECDEAGARIGAVDGYGGWATLALRQDRLELAAERFREMVRRAEQIESMAMADGGRVDLGATMVRLGRAAEATAFLVDAEQGFVARRDLHGAVRAAAWLAVAVPQEGARWIERAEQHLAGVGPGAELAEELADIGDRLAASGRADLSARLRPRPT